MTRTDDRGRAGVYLSLDLDYWACEDHRDDRPAKPSLPYVLNRLAEMRLPLVVVFSHEELIPSVNASGARKLVNVDFHSDLIYGRPTGYLNIGNGEFAQIPTEGDWVNHVSWASEGIYEWRHPQYGLLVRNDLGVCRVEPGPNPFYAKGATPWKLARILTGFHGIEWDRILHVGIAISPEYSRPTTVAKFHLHLGDAYDNPNATLNTDILKGYPRQ